MLDSVVIRRRAEARRRSLGRIRLYANHCGGAILVRCISYGRSGYDRTISSGSSGKRVIVPEPSRSIFCFTRRIMTVDSLAV